MTSDIESKKLTHIAGTYVIDAMPSFLNGGGISKGTEDRNYTIVKTFEEGITTTEGDRRSYKVVFVSAQSVRRMLRDTLLQETNWPKSQIRALHNNAKGNTDKVGGEFDPITYVEDDIFGYMLAKPGSGKVKVHEPVEADREEDGDNENVETQEGTRVRTVSRTSPLATSILVGLRKDGWVGKDDAYVGLVEGSSQPYKTKFANTPMHGIFCLNYKRLCRFSIIGDRVELDDDTIKEYMDNKMLIKLPEEPEYFSLEKETIPVKEKDKKKEVFEQKKKIGYVYEIADAEKIRKERASALIKALAVLRGGAKQAAFETDVSPKVLIMAGLTCGNPIFNTIFEDDSTGYTRGKTVSINVRALKEIVSDYRDRICTPVYIGIRTGFLKGENEAEVSTLSTPLYVVTTPIGAAKQMTDYLQADATDANNLSTPLPPK
jgi:CRISPR-associated protein Cst2